MKITIELSKDAVRGLEEAVKRENKKFAEDELTTRVTLEEFVQALLENIGKVLDAEGHNVLHFWSESRL